MDLNVQLFTGGCKDPADLDIPHVMKKLRRISERVKIKSALIGWNIDIDISEIYTFLKDAGTEVFLWLPVFSELDGMADFSSLIGRNGVVKINYDRGNNESFNFCCPANPDNTDKVIDIYEKYYRHYDYDGIFIDKIRFPSFIGGQDTVFSCYCDYCRKNFNIPSPHDLSPDDATNPLGITGYSNLRYEMSDVYKKLFAYKDTAVFNSIKRLSDYFRKQKMKVGLDLFAPFVSCFVGQNYSLLLPLADMIKPMLYKITNAPAGLPFEIDVYSTAFDNIPINAVKRRKFLTDIVGYEDTDFINREVLGIMNIIKEQNLTTKMYAGIELNYVQDIAPVTNDYIKQSINAIRHSDGIVTSWDLNTTPDSHIDCLLSTWESR